MAQITQLITEASALFFKPLKQIYSATKAQYLCRTISDLDFAALGISRCLSHAKSGHEFLQHHIDHGCKGVTVDHFFKVEHLRNGAKAGRKVLYAWDKACIDYGYWETLKRRAIYFVTEEKSNSAARQISTDITDR
ncbi:MAG: hypothetical protein ACJAQT_004843, partial [Akkermansiaceae bacterium]